MTRPTRESNALVDSPAVLLGLPQRLPGRALRRVPRRALPPGAGRAGGRVFHPRRVERGSPALVVVPRELEIVALPRHAALDGADAAPRVQPGAERLEERADQRLHAQPQA